ncbi:hypothetical protein ACFL13_02870 [Patescibacteria group bacterium]
MIYQTIKTSLISIFLVASMSLIPAHAGYCDTYNNADEPSPADIFCPILKIVNLVVTVAGVLLVIMVVFGGIKLAMSFGDPKGLAGATLSWTWVVIGFFIVVGFFAIYVIIVNLLGIPGFNTPDAIFQQLQERWVDFLRAAGVVS